MVQQKVAVLGLDPCPNKLVQKNLSKNIVKKFCQKNGTPRNPKELTSSNDKFTKVNGLIFSPFSSGQSRFLEAPLVRQADGELKNPVIEKNF